MGFGNPVATSDGGFAPFLVIELLLSLRHTRPRLRLPRDVRIYGIATRAGDSQNA
jgi:hypothetical protein